jgi:tRNA(Ile)-lysidine synthase TilS/MesJ
MHMHLTLFVLLPFLGHLYRIARENNCNKLVLAQHLDDLAETFYMSLMHNGMLRTMKTNYRINTGENLFVIRPMAYCRESIMSEFAKAVNLPVINENCPACFEEPKERARVKSMLKREESMYPNFFDNLRRGLLFLMHDDSTPILRSYNEEIMSRSKREHKSSQQVNRAAAELDSEDKGTLDISEYLALASDEELVRELARRRADAFKLDGAMKCSKNNVRMSGNACRELIE